MNFEFDSAIVDELLLDLGDVPNGIKSECSLVLPYNEYRKYISMKKKNNLVMETYAERNVGLVVAVSNCQKRFFAIGDIVHTAPMVGWKVQLSDKLDITLKVYHNDDILLNIKTKEQDGK